MRKNREASDAAVRVGRKTKNDVILIAALLLLVVLAATLLFVFRRTGDTVVVSVDGQLFGEYSLSEDREVEIKNGEGYNLLVIEGGRAYVKLASCPDGICSSHRPVRNDGESIICLPNRVVIEIRAKGNDQPDVIA